MVSGWFYPINGNQQKHNKAVSSNLFNSSNWKNLRKMSDLDYMTNLDRGLDPDNQQQQQQGFLRSRPSQPGRRSPPLTKDHWIFGN